MTEVKVSPETFDSVLVFALSMDPAEAEALAADKAAIAALLGVEGLDTDHVDLIHVRDLDQLGLTGYLIEGIGADAQAVKADRDRLQALDGWVLLVLGRAFPGGSAHLTLPPELTLIGEYPVPGPDWSARPEPPLEISYRDTPLPAKPAMSDARIGGMIALGVLLFLAIFVFVLVLAS